MTAVIAFPFERCRSASGAQAKQSAEVVIFPGVRVERLEPQHAEHHPVPAKRPSLQLHLQEDYGGI